MIKLIGEHGSGKTSKLLELAEPGSTILCDDVQYTIEKAQRLGITNLDIKHYSDYIKVDRNTKMYIDDISKFAEYLGISGYTIEG